MRKREGKSVELGTPGGGIGAAFVQDIELTAEQIAEAAEKAVVAVEKIAGLKKPSGAGKAVKKTARGRKKAAPAKSAKRTKAKTRKRR